MSMVLSPEMQRMFDGRLRAAAATLRQLLLDIGAELGSRHRADTRSVSDRIDLAVFGVEDLICLDPDSLDDARIAEAHRASNELMSLRAKLDRMRSAARRDEEHVALDRRRLNAEHQVKEIEAELRRFGDAR